MPDKTREMSLEQRLWASLNIGRGKKIGRPRLPDGQLSRPRRPGRAAGVSLVVSLADDSAGALKRPKTRKLKPLRFNQVPQNPEYLKFIRTFSCILNGLQCKAGLRQKLHVCSGQIEAAHTGAHGLKQKAADETALPICSNGHRTGNCAYHKSARKFWAHWGIHRANLVQKFNDLARAEGIHVADEAIL